MVRRRHAHDVRGFGWPEAGRSALQDGGAAEVRASRAADRTSTSARPEAIAFDFMMAPPGRGRLGIGIQELTPQLAEYFGTKDGALVTNVARRLAGVEGRHSGGRCHHRGQRHAGLVAVRADRSGGEGRRRFERQAGVYPRSQSGDGDSDARRKAKAEEANQAGIAGSEFGLASAELRSPNFQIASGRARFGHSVLGGSDSHSHSTYECVCSAGSVVTIVAS